MPLRYLSAQVADYENRDRDLYISNQTRKYTKFSGEYSKTTDKYPFARNISKAVPINSLTIHLHAAFVVTITSFFN